MHTSCGLGRWFPTVRRTSERNKGWPGSYLLPYTCESLPAQASPVTSPDMPPKVFEATGGGIVQALVRPGVRLPVSMDVLEWYDW